MIKPTSITALQTFFFIANIDSLLSGRRANYLTAPDTISSRRTNRTNRSGIVKKLRDERERVEKQLSALNAALTAFAGEYSGSKSKGTPATSVAARKKISRAQKARWAKRTTSNTQATPKPKRTMSAAGRKAFRRCRSKLRSL